jgi:hypothetical protein
VDIKKCEFHIIYMKYLGFIISIEGIKVDPEKVVIIKNWEASRTIRGI